MHSKGPYYVSIKFEMRVFRRIFAIPWADRTNNAEILNLVAKELLHLVKRRKAAYLGHIFRNSKYQFLKLIIKGKTEGRSGIGRKKYSLFRAAQDRIQKHQNCRHE